MGIICNKRGLQAGVFTKTSFSGNKVHSNQQEKCRFVKSRNKFFNRKKRNRNSTQTGNPERFLQYTFSSEKEKWENETSNKFTSTKSVSSETTLQNGNDDKSSQSSQTRGLEFFPRFVRCLFTYSHIPKTSKISSFLCAGSSVSIQSSLFRSNKRTTGVYQDNISGGSLLKKTRHKNDNLFRRLVHSEPTEKNACPRSGGNDQSPCSTRFHYQCRKIGVNSNSRNNIHRGLVQTKTRLRVSNSRTFAESKNCNYKVNTRSDISTSLSQNSGVNCIMSRTHSKQQTIHETNTNACFTSLEPI